MRSLRLTPARRAALEVLAKTNAHIARESNVTELYDTAPEGCQARGEGSIYWQARQWLSREGFIEPAPRFGRTSGWWYQLTDSGKELARREGLLP